MKTNKIVLLIAGITLFSFLAIPVFADPSDGLIKINKRKHIARDPLIDGTGTTSGWVTFACQSLDGLEYSVSVKGLDPSTTYTVRAESLSALWAPFPPFFGWIPTSDGGGITHSLGVISTNGEGEGEVSDIVPLLPGIYNFEIIVADPDGIDVLWTIPCIPYAVSGDSVDFFVLPSW